MGWNGNLCFCNVVAQLWPALWDPMDLEPARLFHPWTYPGKQIGVRSHSLLQGSFPIKESNLRLLLGRLILYHWATWETQTVLNKSLFIKHCQAKLQKNGCLLLLFLVYLFVLAAPDGLQALTSPTRTDFRTSTMKAQSTNHGFTREFPDFYTFKC